MSKKSFNNWWLVLIAGILFVILGVSFIVAPGAALVTTGMLIGLVILISGLAIMSYAISLSNTEGWGWKLAEGIIDIILGIIIMWNPFASAMLIPIAIGIWAIVRGVILFVDSFSYKKMGVQDWWGFLLLGILAVIIGFIVLGHIGASAIVTGWMIGIMLLAIGIAGIYYSLRIKKIEKHLNQ